MNPNEFLWVEKYRPKTISDCVLPDNLRDTFLDIIKSGEMQNLLLSGSAGSGKTTVAKALCDEMGLDWIFINASENGNIDTLRTTIKNFASTVSLTGAGKVVILDEADYLNPQSTMPALRGFIEEFSNNCRFILTCNFRNRIIEPLQSRCSGIEFKFSGADKPILAKRVFDRVSSILTSEKIAFAPKDVALLVAKYYPDFRRMIGEAQRNSGSGTLNIAGVSKTCSAEIVELMSHMKKKDYSAARRWIGNNIDLDPNQVFRALYDTLAENITKATIPAAVLIIADYQYKMAFSADPEICMAACVADLMVNVEFQ